MMSPSDRDKVQGISDLAAAFNPTGYVSMLCANGVPILPPVMTPAYRAEMAEYKKMAIEKERVLQQRRKDRAVLAASGQPVPVRAVPVRTSRPASVISPIPATTNAVHRQLTYNLSNSPPVHSPSLNPTQPVLNESFLAMLQQDQAQTVSSSAPPELVQAKLHELRSALSNYHSLQLEALALKQQRELVALTHRIPQPGEDPMIRSTEYVPSVEDVELDCSVSMRTAESVEAISAAVQMEESDEAKRMSEAYFLDINDPSLQMPKQPERRRAGPDPEKGCSFYLPFEAPPKKADNKPVLSSSRYDFRRRSSATDSDSGKKAATPGSSKAK